MKVFVRATDALLRCQDCNTFSESSVTRQHLRPSYSNIARILFLVSCCSGDFDAISPCCRNRERNVRMHQAWSPRCCVTKTVDSGLPRRGEENQRFAIAAQLLTWRLAGQSDLGSNKHLLSSQKTFDLSVPPIAFRNGSAAFYSSSPYQSAGSVRASC